MLDKNQLQQVIEAMACGFKKESDEKNAERLRALGDSPLQMFEQALLSLSDGDLSGLSVIQQVLSLPEIIFTQVVADEFPDKTPSERDNIVFFLTNFSDLESAATRWFDALEGGACSADKGRTLQRMLWSYLAHGKAPQPNYRQKYTYHLSCGSLIHAHENIAWFWHFVALRHGRFMDYMRFMAQCTEQMKIRYETPDVDDEYCIPFEAPQGEPAYETDYFAGKPHIQILASLKKHRPDWACLPERAHVLRYNADLEELKPLMTRKHYQSLSRALLDWALQDQAFPVQKRGWPVRFFSTSAALLNFLTARLNSSLRRPSDYKQIMADYRALKPRTRRAS